MDIITHPKPRAQTLDPTANPQAANSSLAVVKPGTESSPLPPQTPTSQIEEVAVAQPAASSGGFTPSTSTGMSDVVGPSQVATPGTTQNPTSVPKDADTELDNIMNEVSADNTQVSGHKDEHKSSRPVLVAVIALVIALLLMVVAFFAFRNTKSLDEGINAGKQNSANQQHKALTTADLTTTSQEIDKQFGALSDQDFATEAVSDASLGLQ